MKKNPIARSTFAEATYKNLCSDVPSLLELARHRAGRAVHDVMTCRSFVYFLGRDAEASIGRGDTGINRYLQQYFL